MPGPEVIEIITQLFFGFLAAFIAVLSWSKTRDASWMFIISGTLLHYIWLIFQLLTRMEVLSPDMGILAGWPLLTMSLSALPFLFYSLGFIFFLIKRRRYS